MFPEKRNGSFSIMKIVFTGGGSGGHFYPIIAVAEAMLYSAREKKLLPPVLYFFSDDTYDKKALFDNGIKFRQIKAGKLRRYFSAQNFIDFFKTGWGIIQALIALYGIFPDVVFCKGGYASFPTLLAAKLLRIPVVIHESDSVPGRVNLFAGSFAKRIAISFAEAGSYFPKDRTAYTGNPLRQAIKTPIKQGAHEFLKLSDGTPVILILGGSLGAEKINDVIIEALPELLVKYQIIHQTGVANLNEVISTTKITLRGNQNENRYRPFGYLNDLALRMSAGVANLVVSRAGSGIFEIAHWGIPSILVPITDSNGDHQRKNAFNYARSGAAIVIEEANFSPHLLVSEIDRLFADPSQMEEMSKRAKEFSHNDAAELIANEILEIALEHES